jgi:hypothetical protein
MEVLTLASLIALGMTMVRFLKFLKAADWNAVTVQSATWIVGIALVFLAAEANVTSHLTLWSGVPPLADINAASKVLLGLMFLSLGSQVYEFKKALDHNDTAAEPALLPDQTKVINVTTGEATDPPRRQRKAKPTA